MLYISITIYGKVRLYIPLHNYSTYIVITQDSRWEGLKRAVSLQTPAGNAGVCKSIFPTIVKEWGGVVGRCSLWLAGDISVYLKDTAGGLCRNGEFYIMNCKWLPWGRSIVRKWGEWRSSVYLMPVIPSLLNKTQGHEGAI